MSLVTRRGMVQGREVWAAGIMATWGTVSRKADGAAIRIKTMMSRPLVREAARPVEQLQPVPGEESAGSLLEHMRSV